MPIEAAGKVQIAPREGVLDRLSARLRSHQLDGAVARGATPKAGGLTDGTGPLHNANSTANLRARADAAASNLRLRD